MPDLCEAYLLNNLIREHHKPIPPAHHMLQAELEIQNEELRRTQAALEESRDRYIDLYDSAPIAYLTVSGKGLVKEANLTCTALLGMERNTLMNQRFDHFILAQDRARWDIHWLNLLHLVARKFFELQIKRCDGSTFQAQLDCQKSSSSDAVRIAITDISERKLAETERDRLEKVLEDNITHLERSKSVAEKANLAKSDFISSMSHELRTPLNAILGFTQLLEMSLPVPTAGQAFKHQQILKAGWYLLELINEILDLAMVDKRRANSNGDDAYSSNSSIWYS